MKEVFRGLLAFLAPERLAPDRIGGDHTLFQDIVPEHLQPIVGLASICIAAPFFALGAYHFYMTLQHRNGHWSGNYIPLFGPFLNVALDKEGIRHRSKMLLYFAIAAPFMILIVPQMT